jgi:hypothetical protein
MLLFIVFGPWSVWQLSVLSQAAVAEAPDPGVLCQERALTKFCCGLYVFFYFFALTLFLRPINEKLSLLMIPGTFAYMTAFYYLITGFLPPELRRLARYSRQVFNGQCGLDHWCSGCFFYLQVTAFPSIF